MEKIIFNFDDDVVFIRAPRQNSYTFEVEQNRIKIIRWESPAERREGKDETINNNPGI